MGKLRGPRRPWSTLCSSCMSSELLPEVAGPISPELVLVAPPEVAALLRQQLPDPPWLTYAALNGASGPAEASDAGERVIPLAPVSAPRPLVQPETQAGARVRSRSFELEPAPEPVAAAPAPVAQPSPESTGRAGSLWPRIRLGTVAALLGVVAGVGIAASSIGKGVSDATVRVAEQMTPTSPPPSSVPSVAPATPPTNRGSNTQGRTQPAPTRGTKQTATTPPRSSAPSRAWTWRRQRRAVGYRVRFLRNGRLVYAAQVGAPRLIVAPRFRFRPGRYRWIVNAIFAKAGTKRSGKPLVDTTFLLDASSAARINLP
jgi:hypothetical protein